jgi:hypothetical protein
MEYASVMHPCACIVRPQLSTVAGTNKDGACLKFNKLGLSARRHITLKKGTPLLVRIAVHPVISRFRPVAARSGR